MAALLSWKRTLCGGSRGRWPPDCFPGPGTVVSERSGRGFGHAQGNAEQVGRVVSCAGGTTGPQHERLVRGTPVGANRRTNALVARSAAEAAGGIRKRKC